MITKIHTVFYKETINTHTNICTHRHKYRYTNTELKIQKIQQKSKNYEIYQGEQGKGVKVKQNEHMLGIENNPQYKRFTSNYVNNYNKYQ